MVCGLDGSDNEYHDEMHLKRDWIVCSKYDNHYIICFIIEKLRQKADEAKANA